MASTTLFRSKAPGIMAMFIADLGVTIEDASAILGNVGHECAGFMKMQEIKPVGGPGARGGYGWPQWTGPRRRAYEKWCKDQNLDPAGDDANYGYMRLELQGAYKSTVARLKRAPLGGHDDLLHAKVVAFELAYEAAGVKHYESRERWANIALAAYRDRNPEPEVIGRDAGEAPDDDAPLPAPRPSLTSAEIEAGQRLLRDLKYYEVGDVDGAIGSRTIAAIAAFQHDRGLYGAPALDGGMIAALERARDEGWTRPISAQRAEGEPDGSRIIASAERQTAVTTTAAAPIVGGGLMAWLAQQFGGVRDFIEPIMPIVRPIAHVVVDYWWAFAGAGLIYFVVEQIKTRRARVEDYREGKTT